MVTGLSMMVADNKKSNKPPRLQQGADFTSYTGTEQFVNQAFENGTAGIYNTLSMLFWGLIIAKAKTGISVTSSKDSDHVQASWKKVLKIVLVVGITSFIQTKYEPTTKGVSNQVQQAGRNLRATNNLQVDYQALLQDTVEQWKLNKKLLTTKNLQSSPKMEQTITSIKNKLTSVSTSFLAFVLFLGYYLVTFRRYQLALESHQSLTDLMNDPTVRVAHGDQAKKIFQSQIVAGGEDFQEIKRQEERQVKADKSRVNIIKQLQQTAKPKYEYELCENFEIELQPKVYTADQVQLMLAQQKAQLTTPAYPLNFTSGNGFGSATNTISQRNMMY